MSFFKKVFGRLKEKTLSMMDNQNGQERELLMGELSEHLHKLGINASPLEPDSPEAFRSPLYVLGCIKIEGRNIDVLQVNVVDSGGGGGRTYEEDSEYTGTTT
jgi:hypothetical protein